MRWLFVALLLALSFAAHAHEPLPDKECNCWQGTSDGNDSVSMLIRLCRDGKKVHGTFDWQGSESGHSVRELEGKLTKRGLRLKDVAMPVNEPNPPWGFCLIDEYLLEWDDDGGMKGSYWSRRCLDRATIELEPAADDVCEPDAGVS